jgi:hypothetical protein
MLKNLFHAANLALPAPKHNLICRQNRPKEAP